MNTKLVTFMLSHHLSDCYLGIFEIYFREIVFANVCGVTFHNAFKFIVGLWMGIGILQISVILAQLPTKL
jgi:hypothetical protein